MRKVDVVVIGAGPTRAPVPEQVHGHHVPVPRERAGHPVPPVRRPGEAVHQQHARELGPGAPFDRPDLPEGGPDEPFRGTQPCPRQPMSLPAGISAQFCGAGAPCSRSSSQPIA